MIAVLEVLLLEAAHRLHSLPELFCIHIIKLGLIAKEFVTFTFLYFYIILSYYCNIRINIFQ